MALYSLPFCILLVYISTYKHCYVVASRAIVLSTHFGGVKMSRKIIVFFLIALGLFFTGCQKSESDSSASSNSESLISDTDLGGIELSTGKLVQSFEPALLHYTSFVESSIDRITITAYASDANATVGGQINMPVNLEYGKNDISITVAAKKGFAKKYYTVTVYRLTETRGLPIMKVNLDSGLPVTSKEEWVPAHYTLYSEDGITVLSNGKTGIKGRGNSTWEMPKKPYGLKLDKKTSLLGMDKHKSWVLLANYSDKTLLRTEFAFCLGKNIFNKLSWTPDVKSIDLFINSEYAGVYQLAEQIKIDSSRVDIPDISETSDLESGGFILEVNSYLDEIHNFTSAEGVPVSLKDPDEVDSDTFEYIRNKFQTIEDALYSEDFTDPEKGYLEYIDLDSFVDWYLINELTKNNDAIFHSSVYMFYNPATHKMHMGPVWDYDISSGNIDFNGCDNPEGFWIKNAKWISRMLQDPVFANTVISRWEEKKVSLYEAINSTIQDNASAIKDAQQYNFLYWDILDLYVWPNRVVTGSYSGEISELANWLNSRYAWMDANINSLKK